MFMKLYVVTTDRVLSIEATTTLAGGICYDQLVLFVAHARARES